jgi:4-hydroxybenzoate polyprenyltransferase
MGQLLQNWWIFVRERFPLASHIPMVGLFSLGNLAMTDKLLSIHGNWPQFPAIFVLTFMFFFRLRCFDEIKDYEVDLKVNPTRPLARGVLSIRQVKIMIAILCGLELFLASRMGMGPLAVHAVAMAYSFLMYNEFFIGDMLRPHLTTYAVTHTFVSMLLGWSISAQSVGFVNEGMIKTIAWTGPINWALFNLFEFARKTFAPDEERPHVESYSSIFGTLGAVALSMSQVIVALVVLWIMPMQGFFVQASCALIPFAAGLYFYMDKTKKAAGAFRGITAAYLLLFYIVLTYQGLLL